MEKVLIVINAQKPNLEAIHFACTIAALAHTNLTGLFVENFYLNHIPSSVGEYPSYFDVVKEKKVNEVKADTEQAITIFKNECRRRGVTAKTYVDKGEPIQEVIFESRFADLLVVDPAIGLYETEEQLPSHFVKEILARAECPVLLAPEEFESVDEIVFCYDGSASCVFAIKQFTYLLPEFRNKKVMLLEVNKTGEEEFDEGHRRVMDLLRAHYSSVRYHALKGDPRNELVTYFFMQSKKIVVLGAYGRSMLSNFFKKSNADRLLRTVDLPLFIAHL